MVEKPIYGVGLDAGSRTTRVVICGVERGHLRFLGAGAAPAQGWVKSRIDNSGVVADSIRTALAQAQDWAGVNVESAVVGMGGQTVRGGNGQGSVDLGHVREIEQRDIKRAIENAKRVKLAEDRMVLQLYPQDFVVDGYPGHRTPLRMPAANLKFNVHLVTVSTHEHNSLVGAVNQASLLVEETVFEAQAACYSAVRPEDRRDGVAVLDIGAESSGMVVYYGDSIQRACTIQGSSCEQVAGDSFTRDLARALHLSFEDAEWVKIEYGCAAPDDCAERVQVELPTPEEREPRQARLKLINIVMQARATDLFRLVRNELQQIGMERALLGGIYLCGGAAQLPDLLEVADDELKCNARFGLPGGIDDWPPEMKTPEWTAAAGLAMYSARLKARSQAWRANAGWLGRVLRPAGR